MQQVGQGGKHCIDCTSCCAWVHCNNIALYTTGQLDPHQEGVTLVRGPFKAEDEDAMGSLSAMDQVRRTQRVSHRVPGQMLWIRGERAVQGSSSSK